MTSTTTTPDKDGFDIVKKPKHYNVHPSGVECHVIAEPFGYYLGNAIKYIWRNGIKSSDTAIQDLKKAIWYLEAEIKKLEGPKTDKVNLVINVDGAAVTKEMVDQLMASIQSSSPTDAAQERADAIAGDVPKADALHPG